MRDQLSETSGGRCHETAKSSCNASIHCIPSPVEPHLTTMQPATPLRHALLHRPALTPSDTRPAPTGESWQTLANAGKFWQKKANYGETVRTLRNSTRRGFPVLVDHPCPNVTLDGPPHAVCQLLPQFASFCHNLPQFAVFCRATPCLEDAHAIHRTRGPNRTARTDRTSTRTPDRTFIMLIEERFDAQSVPALRDERRRGAQQIPASISAWPSVILTTHWTHARPAARRSGEAGWSHTFNILHAG